MATSPRALIILSMSLLLPGPIDPAFSDTHDKESSTEAPAPRPQRPPPASDGQPAPTKPPTDVKPQSSPAPTTKTDTSTDHKEVAPEKPAPPKPSTDAKPQSPPSPPTKSDSTDHKEVTPEKHAPTKPPTEGKAQSAPAPVTKADSQPAESESKEKEKEKEKEQTAKRPLGSLILSVKLALMGDPRLFRYEIEVGDDQQTVTLAGRVSTEEEKTAATEIAQAVPGVKAVVNQLAVEKDLAKTLLKKQDETLTTLIKERFSKSATLKAANFEVKTEDGVVQLNGTVRFQVTALEAAETARQVPGVRAVNTEKIRLEGES